MRNFTFNFSCNVFNPYHFSHFLSLLTVGEVCVIWFCFTFSFLVLRLFLLLGAVFWNCGFLFIKGGIFWVSVSYYFSCLVQFHWSCVFDNMVMLLISRWIGRQMNLFWSFFSNSLGDGILGWFVQETEWATSESSCFEWYHGLERIVLEGAAREAMVGTLNISDFFVLPKL